MSQSSSSSSGIGVLGLLGVAFVVLKLMKIIDWSWWWVTLPFWGELALLLIILFGAGALYGLGSLLSSIGRKKKRNA